MNEGVISGEDMLYFVTLHLRYLKLSDNILERINSWWGWCDKISPDARELVQKGQVITGNFTKLEELKIPVTIKQGFYVCIPPHVADDIAIEESERVIRKLI